MKSCVILCFRRELDKMCVLLEFCAACSGNSFSFSWPLNMRLVPKLR